MPGTEARVEAQAKLNLFLRVLARDDSGFHQIETLFCRIALADTVTIRLTSSGRTLECHGERIPAGGLGPVEKNLAWRAAASYAKATGFPHGFEITIDKKIPVGGGLGGGSADAGAVLRALNALNPDPVSPGALLGMAATLGADVSFLTQDESVMALGRGYGERLEMVPALPQRLVWLAIPDVGVNTADAYRWLDESERAVPTTAVSGADVSTWEALAAIATNDFEPVVGSRIPIVGRLLAGFRTPELKEVLGGAVIVSLSGSGSTVAVVAGSLPPHHLEEIRPLSQSLELVGTITAAFVEPVVLTH
jgi:4-diphosphocytidyl-2-C-methyl-D-erythritol kinase